MGSLGILPYINSSIVIQLLTPVIPALERLQKGVEVSKHCRERQHFLRCSKLALMHERNNYLRKLRIIEELGRRNEWHIRKNDGNELLLQVYKVLNRS